MPGFRIYLAPQDSWPDAWRNWTSTQTLQETPDDPEAFLLTGWGLPENAPHNLPATILEQLAWGLAACTDATVVVCPLYTSLRRKHPPYWELAPRTFLTNFLPEGAIALWREQGIARLKKQISAYQMTHDAAIGWQSVYLRTRALLEERRTYGMRVPYRRRMCLKLEEAERFLRLHGPTFLRKHFTPGIQSLRTRYHAPDPSIPAICVRPFPKDAPPCIWLAVGTLGDSQQRNTLFGFLNSLPVKDMSVVMTIDHLPDEALLRGMPEVVREVWPLSSFLPPQGVAPFAAHLARTHNIRLLHLHGSGLIYECLPRLKETFPALQAISTPVSATASPQAYDLESYNEKMFSELTTRFRALPDGSDDDGSSTEETKRLQKSYTDACTDEGNADEN